jgi:ABC-type cobalamin transport system ATPase subunit
MPWTTSLARTIKPRNHTALHTLAEARAYMLELPKDIADRPVWQHTGQLLLTAAETQTKPAIDDVTKQLELALFVTYRQDMSKI